MSLPLADAVRGMIHVLGDAEWEADARKIADNIAKLERENAALRKALEEAFAESDDTVRFHIIRNAVEALKEAQP